MAPPVHRRSVSTINNNPRGNTKVGHDRVWHRGTQFHQERRAVITGVGAVTPLGGDFEKTWQRAIAGESGLKSLTRCTLNGLSVRAAGEVVDFDSSSIASKRERRYLDDFCLYALAAATEAMTDSHLTVDAATSHRFGVILGTGFGGISSFERSHDVLLRRGPHRVGPHAIPAAMANAAAAHLAQRFGIRGINHTVMTSCASGAHAIGTALRLIQKGDVDVVIAGGTEAPICPSVVAGFRAMGALSLCPDPSRASRPFDAKREGFVIGEGAGILVVEELECARARSANVYAEIIGYGASADAYHVCAPPSDGAGARQAMAAAIADAGIDPEEIDCVSAHGTSTRYNDVIETKAIKAVLGDHAYHVPVTATKSMIGHLIGAGGAVESILIVKALVEGVLPPTLNQEKRDPECDLDYVPRKARRARLRVALKNSFGFGGNNASLVFRTIE